MGRPGAAQGADSSGTRQAFHTPLHRCEAAMYLACGNYLAIDRHRYGQDTKCVCGTPYTVSFADLMGTRRAGHERGPG